MTMMMMSTLMGSEDLGVAVSGTTLTPSVTRVEPRIDVNPVSVILAVCAVFVLAPITISGNTIILAAFYRYKRLRTASNCLLASLAVSDFGVGIFMPFGMHLELSGLPDNSGISTVCIAPYCIVIALCSVSVLVTVAIAVDRLTSLAQPLRYKNIITHSSVEKYIAVFWLYAICVGLSPLIYVHTMGLAHTHNGSCRFGTAVRPPVQVFLVIAVWAPSALVLLGCYMYVYLVARAHARAIYTVELSFRHQTQTIALPRYGQTLAVTVGTFLILWLPFQACMLLDIYRGTNILSQWTVVWLGLPILSQSAANPWIYAFHHGDMRVAATKIAEKALRRFVIHPSGYGCSAPMRHRGESNVSLELAGVSKRNEQAPPIEDCFAADKTALHYYYGDDESKLRSGVSDISPEEADSKRFSDGSSTVAGLVEEDIRDLAKMLKPEYAIDRNMDKMKNLKYLLDPSFMKIRHLRRLNRHKLSENAPKFSSYENFKSDLAAKRNLRRQLNAQSDPTLNSVVMKNKLPVTGGGSDDPLLRPPTNYNLSSISDPNFKADKSRVSIGNWLPGKAVIRAVRDGADDKSGGHLIVSLKNGADESASGQTLQRRRIDGLKKWSESSRILTVLPKFHIEEGILREKICAASITDEIPMRRIQQSRPPLSFNSIRLMNIRSSKKKLAYLSRTSARKRLIDDTIVETDDVGHECNIKHSESISEIAEGSFVGNSSRLFVDTGKFMDHLGVPSVHSEPPSPVDPLHHLDSSSFLEQAVPTFFPQIDKTVSAGATTSNPWGTMSFLKAATWRKASNVPRPCVWVNFEDSIDEQLANSGNLPLEKVFGAACPADRTMRRSAATGIFGEHDTTRFGSRRPSNLRWSESSRSQEILSNVNEHQKSPSSYSVDNYDNRPYLNESAASSITFNDATCLGSFACSDPLSSSLRESFFETPSVPDSESLESPVNLLPPPTQRQRQKKSNESLGKLWNNRGARGTPVVVRLEASVQRSRDCGARRVKPRNDTNFSIIATKFAPLAPTISMEISTPTYEINSEIEGIPGLGVRV